MDILTRVRDIAQAICRAEGAELLDVALVREGGHQVLRLTVERESGPTMLADCEAVSRGVSAALDAADIVPFTYLLEVSSPGADRPLTTLRDFRRQVGSRVHVYLRGVRSGPLAGTLTGAAEGGLTLVLADGSRRTVPLAEVAEARREIPFGNGEGRP
jgi:ribosome maturation factor RimP